MHPNSFRKQSQKDYVSVKLAKVPSTWNTYACLEMEAGLKALGYESRLCHTLLSHWEKSLIHTRQSPKGESIVFVGKDRDVNLLFLTKKEKDVVCDL